MMLLEIFGIRPPYLAAARARFRANRRNGLMLLGEASVGFA
jgi:hypothetical protein